eukprot:6476178-Pyramimonas_sp.AAC.1
MNPSDVLSNTTNVSKLRAAPHTSRFMVLLFFLSSERAHGIIDWMRKTCFVKYVKDVCFGLDSLGSSGL